MKRNRKMKVKLIAASLLTCALAAGCANKKNSTSQRASAVPPLNQAVANVPASPPSEPAPVAAPPTAYTPPAPPQPVVYDPAAEQPVMHEPIADASDSSVAPVTRARPARKASAKTSASGTKYKVKKGDSLWSIAQAKYGNGNKWKQIAAANPKINPDRVQAGQTITLP
jgi:5'-nucleotidase